MRIVHTLLLILVLGAICTLHGQPRPRVTIQRQRVVQSCGATLDATAVSGPHLLNSIVGLTSIGRTSSRDQAKKYLGFWVPIPVILGAEDGGDNVVTGARIAAWPNPFRELITIDLQCDHPTGATADVYSSIGKHLSAVPISGLRTDGITFTWNGTSSDGQACAAGSYTIRILVHDPLYRGRLLYSTTVSKVH